MKETQIALVLLIASSAGAQQIADTGSLRQRYAGRARVVHQSQHLRLASD